MDRGYVKVWRKSLDSKIIQNHELWALWTWCLMKATHKPHKQLVSSRVVNLKPGQLVFGRDIASKALKLHPSKIYRLLNKLKDSGSIKVEPNNRFSIISIINWDIYQGEETESEQQANNRTPKIEQQDAQNRTTENEKSNNKDDSEEPLNKRNFEGGEQPAEQLKVKNRTTKRPKSNNKIPKIEHKQEHIQEQIQEQKINSILPGGNTLSAVDDVFLSIPLIPRDGEYQISEKQVSGWQRDYPKVDVRQELVKIKNWNIAHPKRRKTKSGILKHIVSWLGKEQDRGGGGGLTDGGRVYNSRAAPDRSTQNKLACESFIAKRLAGRTGT